jgi:predicted ATPase/class 3 adenylate cyclase
MVRIAWPVLEGDVTLAGGEVVAPSGPVTFLFTDVEGSTRLWEGHPDEMRVALEAHDEILRQSIEVTGGFVFSTAGDAFAAAFESPGDAISAAERAQRDLAGHAWPEDVSMRVRMGVHTGVAQQRDDDYFGPTLNRTARLMSAAHGGQTVVSSATRSLVDGVALRDLGEHRLKDLSEPEHVWQLTIDGLAGEFPPLRTLDAVPGNLPTDSATFIGRHDDIGRLMKSLEGHRLVTLTGVGGVGKTRLSLQVAADASHHYPQGLWFVELAPVLIEDAVPYRFLETLGLDAEPGQSPVETAAEAVSDGSVLLVVDNCEHVLRATGDVLGELLGACPNLKVLASSRRALGMRGEQVHQIQPLDTSGATSAATHLFLDRATAARADVDLTDRLDVITDICTHLDGVPLAIELAAARTRSMTPEDLAGRLDDRFRLLRGSRSAAGEERHKTLLSTIEWSYELLDEDQQMLFQRLSVFAGSFTLEAAEQICADENLDRFDVIDLVDDLVDHSLLIADVSGELTRYRMLETIREFAGRELGDELTALRERHGEYHAQWVDRLWARMRTTDESAAVGELEAGWSDLRAAVVHATGDLSLLARLLGPLTFDAFFRSRLEFGDWATAALAVADLEGAADNDRAVLLGAAAAVAGLAGDAERAVALCSELAALCENTEAMMPLDVASPVVGAAIVAGDLDLAGRLQDLSEQTAAEGAEPWALAMTATRRAVVATYSGQPAIAKQACATATELIPPDFSPSFRAQTGWISAVNSDAPRTEVAAQMEEVVEQARLVRSSFLQSIYTQYLASVRAELGDLTQAMSDAADNLERLLVAHNLGLVAPAVRRAAVILIKAGQPDTAARLLGWVDNQDSRTPATEDLAVEIEILIPQMHEALGPDAAGATEAGAALTVEEAIELAISALRTAADDPS